MGDEGSEDLGNVGFSKEGVTEMQVEVTESGSEEKEGEETGNLEPLTFSP